MSARSPAPVVVQTQILTNPQDVDVILAACHGLVEVDDRRSVAMAVYLAPNRDSVLILEGYESVASLGDDGVGCHSHAFRRHVAPVLSRDLRSSVLQLDDIVKASALPVPSAPRLQVRYIEVPPRVADEYRAWRARTIFPYVRASTEVDAFLAYRSIFGDAPGIYFLSESSCDQDRYMAVFSTPAYQAIVAEAGARYIANGVTGLRTEEWSLFRTWGDP